VIVKSVPNNSTHVINVNGKNYVPVNNQTLRPVIIGGIKYLPVYKAPARKLDSLLPITAKKHLKLLNIMRNQLQKFLKKNSNMIKRNY
jgi:hypothetical protein